MDQMPRGSRRITRSTAVGACLIAAAALGLGACSSDEGDGDASPSPSASESGAPSVPDAAEGPKDALPVLAEGWAGILSDVQVQDCPIKAGEVTAKGTVTNSADESRDIAIVVSWNAPNTTDPTMRLVWTATEVGAGETQDWSVTGDLPSDAGRCIVGAQAGTITSQ
jgi:hypothetical protein